MDDHSSLSQTHNNGNNANIGIRGFPTWRQKKSNDKMLPPMRIEPRTLMNLWSQVQHSPFWAKWASACNTETLGSLYSHGLLIPIKSSKSKNQVMHEQKFKDPLTNTCPLSSERRALDSEWEVHERPEFYLHWGNIATDFFLFSCSKASDANIGITTNFV